MSISHDKSSSDMQGKSTNPPRRSSCLAGAAMGLRSFGYLETARAKLASLAKDSISFRLLNALLAHAPTVEGVDVIATDIIAASAEKIGLHQLAQFYKTGLLLPMKAGGRTPQVSFNSSRDHEIQSEVNVIAADLGIAIRDPATLKKYTLHRDGYRCVVTHRWDYSLPYVEAEFDPSTESSTMTEVAHILPVSLMSADTNKKLFKKCKIWSVITSLTTIEFKELSGNKINSLKYFITLDAMVHNFFGLLDLWFEALPGTPNTYKIRKAHEHILRDVSEGTEVTFTSPDPEAYPLPNPCYLAFHAAISKVVHMADMAEHLDDLLKRYEKIRVLSDDSGLEYLDVLLRAAQRHISGC